MLYISEDAELLDLVESGDFKRGGEPMAQMADLMPKNIFSFVGDVSWFKQWDGDAGNLPFSLGQATANRKKSGFILYMDNERTNSLEQLLKELDKVYRREHGLQI